MFDKQLKIRLKGLRSRAAMRGAFWKATRRKDNLTMSMFNDDDFKAQPKKEPMQVANFKPLDAAKNSSPQTRETSSLFGGASSNPMPKAPPKPKVIKVLSDSHVTATEREHMRQLLELGYMSGSNKKGTHGYQFKPVEGHEGHYHYTIAHMGRDDLGRPKVTHSRGYIMHAPRGAKSSYAATVKEQERKKEEERRNRIEQLRAQRRTERANKEV